MSRSARRALFAAGVLASLLLTLPLLPPPGSEDWLRRPLADDAYYELAVARSLASGQGPAVEGQPTSGFQPLYTLGCLALGGLAGWDPLGVPLAVTALNWLLWSVGGTLLVARLWTRLHPEQGGTPIALFAPAVWLLNAPGQAIVLNGMETTLALVFWCLVALALPSPGEAVGLRSAVALGVALGGAFLARNDTVLLIVPAVLLVAGFRSRAVTLAVAFACALPWLAFTTLATGSVLPQGGRVERLGGLYDLGRGHQLSSVLEGLARNVVLVPIPFGSLPAPARIAVLAGALAACAGILALLLRRSAPGAKRVVLLVGVALAGLTITYAGFFGAGHMARRWMAPGVFAGVLFAAEALAVLHRSRPRLAGRLAAGLVLVVLAGRCGWVIAERHRPSPTNTWALLQFVRTQPLAKPVGAFQSGLLAWMQPGIVNLDGKTNRAALLASEQGRLGAWLVESPIQTVVDSNLLGLERDPRVQAAFRWRRTPDGVVLLERRRPADPLE